MTRSFFRLPRTVLVLGAVSFMNDVASEMVTPLLPIFLTSTLGAGPAVLGLIEGVADATASLLKLFTGMVADRTGRWRIFVRVGYAISNVARPLVSLAGTWGIVLGLRFLDRLGKGTRSAPRDAMIADSAAERDHGKAFGYHRAMDHAGASLGPVIAFALLAYGLTLERVILLSAVPGILVLIIVWLGLKKTPLERIETGSVFHWSKLSPDFKRLVAAAGGVAFAAVPDVLLILWVFRSGIQVGWIPLLWAVAHLGRMGTVAITGTFSDRYGRKVIMITGWAVRIALLVVLALAPGTPTWAWPLFLVYTAVTAWTESVERAWLSDLAPSGKRATVFGAFHMVTGLAVLPGAILIGSLWEVFDMKTAFLASAFMTAISAAYLFSAAGRLKTGEVISDSD